MSKATPQIYVDVTQLVHWEGKLTGIPRVMHELAIRFEKEQNAVFVSWVKESAAYYEVDLGQSLREQRVVYIALSREINTIKPALPTPAMRLVRKIAKVGIVQGAKVLPVLDNLKDRVVSVSMQNFRKAHPGKYDWLFIPWGEWWDDNFLSYLEQMAKDGCLLSPVIHDIGPMVQPQFSAHSTESLANYCRRIVPISHLVFAVSKNTKKDLQGWLREEGLPMPAIEIFREGDDFSAFEPEVPKDESFQRTGLKGGDYLMFVGTVEVKKNHMLLYYVYKLAKERSIPLPKLLIVGRLGWHSETLYELVTQDPDTKDKIIFLKNISDEELSWLYDNCMFTLQASFYEGWGIPVAESLSRGVPSLCADTSSMVEIAKGIARHFSPVSTDDCLSKIRDWLDPAELAKAKEKARTYKPTTWDQSYAQIRRSMEEHDG